MTKKKLRAIRKNGVVLLNPGCSSETGLVQWMVSASPQEAAISADLSIWDCSRKINLDFDVYGSSSSTSAVYKQRLRKLSRLIGSLQDMQRQMIAAGPVLTAGIEYAKAQGKKKALKGRRITLDG